MRHRIRAIASALFALVPGACEPFFVCPDDSATATDFPQRLSMTGLYAEDGGIAADVIAYRPRFELWADGAEKRRWARFPAGATIDTTDIDSWVFPVGTRFWKQFFRDGQPIETRLIERRDDGWAGMSYVWREGAALAAPQGAVDARGTQHNVPAAGECAVCHGGRRSFVLGFSAVQLAGQDELSLAAVEERGLLSDAVGELPQTPGSAAQRAAVGYLHSNCSHCHNREPGTSPCFHPSNDLDFTLPARPDGELPALASRGKFVEDGDPDQSLIVERMETRDFIYRMPPIGSEKLDRAGIDRIREWIAELP